MSFASCSSDDDSNNVGSIVGKWNYNRIKTSVNGQVVSDEPYDDDEEACERDYLDIRADSTAEFGDYYIDPGCVLDAYESSYVRKGIVYVRGSRHSSIKTACRRMVDARC